MQYRELSTGYKIPMLGFGVYQIPPEQTEQCVRQALEVGYRHIDTAQAYNNEEGVGRAIASSGIARDDLFVTTKIWVSNYGSGTTRRSLEESLSKLQLDYVDLLLLHQPFNDTYGAWRDLEAAQAEGLVRTIGISNFAPVQAVDLSLFNKVKPAINQIEINPLHQRTREIQQLTERGILSEAWAPFGEGREGLFTNPTLQEIGEAHGKSTAQVMLRWVIQRGVVALAKSVHVERMRENFDIFDFELSDADMEKIATLDTKSSLFFDHLDPGAADFMASYKL